ncbi:MAG: cobalamin biosynthesis protein CobD [Nitrospirae bacterium]|nr:cobalamin biosynthesis protein CobD [Nitrospirota bacterium]
MGWFDPHSAPLIVAAAVLLDVLLADPPAWPHPVRLMGAAIARCERFARPRLRSPQGFRAAGVVLAVALPAASYGVARIALAAAYGVAPWLGFGLAVYLAYACISLAGLGRAVAKVGAALAAHDLPGARAAVGHIVGRDTAALDDAQVAGAAVESAAENCSDGVIAPLFYLMLGGPALALAYKAVNTADSMIGYRDERYVHFGWAAARLDDVANWIPARLTALLLLIAALLTGAGARRGWVVALRDARRHASPNAGWPEAAVAGALGVALGGPAHYGGAPHPRPVLGGEGVEPAAEHVARALRLLWTAGLLGALCAVGLA